MNCAIAPYCLGRRSYTHERFLLQVKHQLPQLQQLIVQANFEQLLAVFQHSQQSRRR